MTCTPSFDDHHAVAQEVFLIAIFSRTFLILCNLSCSSANTHSLRIKLVVRSPPAPNATMVLHNPNNWHWVNKDVSEWTREWFKDNLVNKLEATDGDVTAKISGVQSMDGDVDVSQRKGKVITIFDVKLVLEYSGNDDHLALLSPP